MDVTIDLKELTGISKVAFTSCVEKGDWIFDVRGITVEVSEDGKNFTECVFRRISGYERGRPQRPLRP